MIKLSNLEESKPYNLFKEFYKLASLKGQKNIEAIAISSFRRSSNEVDSRFVNLKEIKEDKWIFYSNYNSEKSKDFAEHKQVSVLIFWRKINLQIRIKANIFKLSDSLSDEHFEKRSKYKNALAISSNQSQQINSYQKVIEKYEDTLLKDKLISKRPSYWGGFYFIPFSFEFWEGMEHRLNKRTKFSIDEDGWKKVFLQP